VIAQNSNRMKTLTVEPSLPPAQPGMKPPNIVIEFKDSMAFLNGSLESLVDSLAKADPSAFTALLEHVRSVLPESKVSEGFALLLRKGVYPHTEWLPGPWGSPHRHRPLSGQRHPLQRLEQQEEDHSTHQVLRRL
jgi:hypothetical protein